MFKKRAKRAFNYDYICPECGHKAREAKTTEIPRLFSRIEYWHIYNCKKCECSWLIINKNKEAKVYDN